MNVRWPYVALHTQLFPSKLWLAGCYTISQQKPLFCCGKAKVFKTFQTSSHSSYQSSTCVGSLTCITAQHLPDDSHQLRNNANDQPEIPGNFIIKDHAKSEIKLIILC